MSQQYPRDIKYKYVNTQIYKQLATWGVGAIDFNNENTTRFELKYGFLNIKHIHMNLAHSALPTRDMALSGSSRRGSRSQAVMHFTVYLNFGHSGDLGFDGGIMTYSLPLPLTYT